jgi:hypothetical protein
MRTQRRALMRENQKLARDRERLARLEPGGAPDRPIEVSTASVVEPTAESLPCPICEGRLRALEHTAENIEGARLRVVHAQCTHCGVRRALYFHIGTALPN